MSRKRKKEEEKVKLNPQYSFLIKFKKYDEDQYDYLQFIIWVLENLLLNYWYLLLVLFWRTIATFTLELLPTFSY